MHNYQGHPGVAFVAARNFQTEYGVHEAGTIVEDAPKLWNLDVLVSAGFLYPFSPSQGYAYLPSHLFSGTNLREEIIAKFEGDPSFSVEQFPDTETPQIVLEAEKQAEVQSEVYEEILVASREAQRNAIAMVEEQEKREVPTLPVKKTAAKKTASTKE